jgi:hypothetical protein
MAHAATPTPRTFDLLSMPRPIRTLPRKGVCVSDHMYWFIQGVGAVVVGLALGVMVTMAFLWSSGSGPGRGRGEDPPAEPPDPGPDWDEFLRSLTERETAKAVVIPAAGPGPGGTKGRRRASAARFSTKPASLGLWCWGVRPDAD